MALTGLKPPPPLNMEGNMAANWRNWYTAYEIYSGASDVTGKLEKIQCFIFLHGAGAEAQKLLQMLEIPSTDQEKIAPLVAALMRYCEGQSNITVVRYKFNSYNQKSKSIDTYIREL